MSTPVKKTKGAEQPAQAQPMAAIDWSQFSGASGFENVTQGDLGVPFINILQTKSAEVDKTHKDYATKRIEGAEAGDIINTVTRKVIAKCEKGSITVIPAFYEKTYVEWKANRGGLVKIHRNPGILDEVTGKTEKNENILRNGNLLIETASFYVLLRDEAVVTQAVINMMSTQLKNARLWLNLAMGIKVGPQRVTPPLFSHHYILSTVLERKDNNSWYGWKVQIGDAVTSRDIAQQAIQIGSRVKLASTPQAALPAPHDDNEVPM